MPFRFVYNEHAAEKLLNDPHGPVGRDLQRRLINVESQAKLNASGPPGPNVITGRLRSSITSNVSEPPFGVTQRPDGSLVGRVGSNVEYAGFVEDKKPYLKPALEAARL